MTLTRSLGSFTSSTPSATWRRLFARTGHAGHAAAASRPGWSPEGAAGQGRTVRSPASAAVTSVPVMPVALAGEGGARRRGVPGAWPLLVVLAVQAALSLRLLRADTASQSEALYLHAGHLEWAHWLHGIPIPPFPSYFLARRSFTRRSARRRTASAGWPAPGSCPWRSCSAPPSCCGVLRPGCSGGGPRSSPPRCSPCWARPCTWGRSPPTTRCRCSWSRWRPGA